MSDYVIIILVVLIMIPATLWLRNFFDRDDRDERSRPGPSAEDE